MASFVNMVSKAANEGKSVIVIVLDTTKAFERVPRRTLPMKVKSYGITTPWWVRSIRPPEYRQWAQVELC